MRGNATARLPYAGRLTTVRRPKAGTPAGPRPGRTPLEVRMRAPVDPVAQENLDDVRGYVGEREPVAR